MKKKIRLDYIEEILHDTKKSIIETEVALEQVEKATLNPNSNIAKMQGTLNEQLNQLQSKKEVYEDKIMEEIESNKISK